MDDFDEKKAVMSDDEDDSRRSVDAPSESSRFEARNWKHTEEFPAVMRIYQESTKEPSIRALNLRGKHTWDEVLEEARACEARYMKASRKGPRKLVRSFSSKAEVMTPWIGLIPNDMCLAVLSGGLKLVFSAATRINEMHEDAISQLLRIPLVIADAEDSCRTFGRDGELFAHAERLYRAALAAIEGMTKWLQQKTISRPLRSIFRGPLYNKPFQDKIKSLDAALSALHGRISILRDGSIRRTEMAVQNVESVLNNMSKQEPGNGQKIVSDALEKMKEMLADRTRTAEWMNEKNKEIARIKKEIQHIQRSKAMSPEELLEILGVEKIHPECDLRRVLRKATPEDDSDEVALGVTQGEKFSQWHSHADSAALFIEGSISSSSECEVPFTSLVSSYFIESVKPHAMCIYFFCGYHVRSMPNSLDSFCGPSAMMRSLIAQTIRESRMEIKFSPYLRSKLESLDFRALCTCFQQLVQHLPVHTVLFCIIDGVSDFERRGSSDDCKKAIDELQDLTYDAGMNAIFKLLVTSPSRSRKVKDSFKLEERLQLNGDTWNDRDGRDFPTEREIMEGTRRPSLKQHLRHTLREQHRCEWPEDDDHMITAPSDSC